MIVRSSAACPGVRGTVLREPRKQRTIGRISQERIQIRGRNRRVEARPSTSR
jgi:hypothetical protein